MKENLNNISLHVKKRRKENKLTQPELALKAGVGLRFVRDLEQGKNTLRTDKVNDVLRLFGEELGVVSMHREKIISNE
ncbi:helix-turn-helix transcriptional regulator [Flavobacterium sp.]|jgi:y4mF family transcriptional regulator|uniref:helix-turn-helix transcriptional regulator n=1 Tax=Flavobacterium sp. TaxID=239 RepID=UPI0037BF847C